MAPEPTFPLRIVLEVSRQRRHMTLQNNRAHSAQDGTYAWFYVTKHSPPTRDRDERVSAQSELGLKKLHASCANSPSNQPQGGPPINHPRAIVDGTASTFQQLRPRQKLRQRPVNNAVAKTAPHHHAARSATYGKTPVRCTPPAIRRSTPPTARNPPLHFAPMHQQHPRKQQPGICLPPAAEQSTDTERCASFEIFPESRSRRPINGTPATHAAVNAASARITRSTPLVESGANLKQQQFVRSNLQRLPPRRSRTCPQFSSRRHCGENPGAAKRNAQSGV